MATSYVTEAEATAFVEKRATFGQGLAAREQALLREVLPRAAGEDDVDGHAFDATMVAAVPYMAHSVTPIVHHIQQIAHIVHIWLLRPIAGPIRMGY